MSFKKFQLNPLILKKISKLDFRKWGKTEEIIFSSILKGKNIHFTSKIEHNKKLVYLISLVEKILFSQNLNEQSFNKTNCKVNNKSVDLNNSSQSLEAQSSLPFNEPQTTRIKKKESPGFNTTNQNLTIDKDLNNIALMNQRAFPFWRPSQFILILVPNQKLAHSIELNFKEFLQSFSLNSLFLNKIPIQDKREWIKEKIDFVFSTPEKLIEFYKNNDLSLSQVCALIFDFENYDLEEPLVNDLEFIFRRLRNEKQVLIFGENNFFQEFNFFLPFRSNLIQIKNQEEKVSSISENVIRKTLNSFQMLKNEVYKIKKKEKLISLIPLLEKWIQENQNKESKKGLLFTSSGSEKELEQMSHFLIQNTYPCLFISNLLSESQRSRLHSFLLKKYSLSLIITKDSTTFYLDFKSFDFIVHFDLPEDIKQYTNRLNFFPRDKKKSSSIHILDSSELEGLKKIETSLKLTFSFHSLEFQKPHKH